MGRKQGPRERLRRSDCSAEGISRRRRGKGFSYLDADRRPIEDEEALARIGDLAIPPGWTDVWICPDPRGHIQATGVDPAGRKRYLYHPRLQRRRSARRFETMREFARALPDLRRAVTRDLRLEGMPRERALACAVRLLDLGFFRILGEEYADGSDGVGTIRRSHVKVRGGVLVVDPPAKSGRRPQPIRDPAARRAIEAMRRRSRGPKDLLAYFEDRKWHDVRSKDIDRYIRAKTGRRFSVRDFRTWHGTVLAAAALAAEPPPRSQDAARGAIREASERVAEALGYTPAACRNSYIDPRVLDRFRDGVAIHPTPPFDARLAQRVRSRIEREVLDLVSDERL